MVAAALALGGCASAGGGGAVLSDPVRPAPPPPPAEVAALLDGFLTTQGTRLYHESDPQILEKAAFDAVCSSFEEGIVLGCFSDGAIVILRVERPELSGIMPVTAAHELLHAAYAALPAAERARIEGWVTELTAGGGGPDVEALLSRYQGRRYQRLDELHSILATEVRQLTPALEGYYARYFSDRMGLVEANERYEAVFAELQARIEGLHARLDELRAEMASVEAELAPVRADLERLDRLLLQRRVGGDIAGYNALVPQQNAVVDRHDALVARYNQLVDAHNAVVDEVNGLALQQNDLATSLGAKPTATE